MTFTLFVSVSLLALVATARPFPLVDGDHSEGLNATPLTSDGHPHGRTARSLRDAVQAVFQSRKGYPLPGLPASLSDSDIRVHLTSPAVLTSHLAALEGLDAVKAVLPLPFSALAGIGADGAALSELTEDERQLYELLSPSLEDIDGGVRAIPELASAPPSPVASAPAAQLVVPSPTRPSPALLVLAVSAVASLLIVACVSLSVYAAVYFRKHVLRSDIAWDIAPRIETGGVPTADASDGEDTTGAGAPTCEKVAVEKGHDLIDFEGPLAHRALEDAKTPPPQYSEKTTFAETDKAAVRPPDSRHAELDDKAAHSSPLLFAPNAMLPSLLVDSHPDPDLLPLPSDAASPAPSPLVAPLAVPASLKRLPSQTQMRECAATALPASKPAWSLRAAASPALGLPASASPQPHAALPSPSPRFTMPGALFSDAEAEQEMIEVQRPRDRAYRAPLPELDIALALQLRPGLGLGAEGAWLVRFLMAMFGWLGVVVGGGGGSTQREQRRAVIA